MNPWSRLAYGVAAFALLAGTVSAQQPMPECAVKCLQSSLQAQDACAPTNTTCICLDAPLMTSISNCVLASCTLKQALVARNNTATMCGEPVRDNTRITPIISGVSGGAAILAILARCYAVGKSFAVDDLFAVISLILALPMGIVEFFMSVDGFGKDVWTLAPDKINSVVRLTWITEVFYFAAVATTKMSFLLFCLRIFPRKQFRRAAHILLVVCVVFCIVFTFVTIFNCIPVSYIWTNWDREHKGKCINFNAFTWSHAAINIFLDSIILGIPIPELLNLSMSSQKKIYIIMMFSIGALTTVVSIIRLQTLVKFAKSPNPTYDYVATAYWSVLEAFLGIFCVCMPALRRFLAILVPSCFGSTHNSNQYEHYDDSGAITPNKPSDTPKKESKSNLNSWRKFGFDTTITKTVDTTDESNIRPGDEDEVMLVALNNARDSPLKQTV